MIVDKNIKIWVSYTLKNTAIWIDFIAVISFLTFHKDVSDFYVVLAGMFYVIPMIFSPFFVKRIVPEKKIHVMLLCYFLILVLTGSLALFESTLFFLVIIFSRAFFIGIEAPLFFEVIVNAYKKEDAAKASSIATLIGAFSKIVAPALGVFTLEQFGFDVVIYTTFFLYLVSFVISSKFLQKKNVKNIDKNYKKNQLKWIFIAPLLVFVYVESVSIFLFQRIIPLFFRENNLMSHEYSYAMTSLAVGAAISSGVMYLSKFNTPKLRHLLWTGLGILGSILLSGFSLKLFSETILFYVPYVFIGVFSSVHLVILNTYVMLYHREHVAVTSAAIQATIGICVLLGPLFGIVLMRFFSVNAVLWCVFSHGLLIYVLLGLALCYPLLLSRLKKKSHSAPLEL